MEMFYFWLRFITSPRQSTFSAQQPDCITTLSYKKNTTTLM